MLNKSILLFGIAFALANSASVRTSPPTWSSSHTVEGVLNLPYAEISEPFRAWFDEASQQSRIDYYRGVVKTYQLPKSYDYGTSIKIVPVTTEEKLNEINCLQLNGTKDETIDLQTVLPDLTDFKIVGNELISGASADIWTLQVTDLHKVNTYTMWVSFQNDPEGNEIAIPVRYEMKGYNTLLGSHYDHYYLEYNFYDPSPVNGDVFKVDASLTCHDFPGPGIHQTANVNPMAEFVHPAKTSHVDAAFASFAEKHNKKYENSSEHTIRKDIFRQNMRLIHSVNRQDKGYTLAINHLADKSPAELRALRGRTFSGGYNGGAPFPYTNLDKLKEALPESFDWRLYGAVTQVKDQAVCGSCWSFGTTGTIEGAYFLRNQGKLVRLSQQALVDCSWGFGNNGCDGGEDWRAYQWIMKHGGIPTEQAYGDYLGEDGLCHVDEVKLVAPITGYVNVTANDPDALRLAIFEHGPISVAIDASPSTFAFYSNGVFYDSSCHSENELLDHSVLAVGYGTINGQDYWLIKNSWSNYWGNDGYILMAVKDNNCGVLTIPTYVNLAPIM